MAALMLREGQDIVAVWWAIQNDNDAHGYKVGLKHVGKITVVHMPGQCGYVFWVLIQFDDGSPQIMVNLAHVEELEL